MGPSHDLTTITGCFSRGSRSEPGTFATVIGWGSIPMCLCVYTAGTPNNHFWMDVWLNSNFQCKDLESSNWNNRKELVVWSSRFVWLHIMWLFAFHTLYMNKNSLSHLTGHLCCSNLEKKTSKSSRFPRFSTGQEMCYHLFVVNWNQLIADMNLEVVYKNP